MSEANSRAAPPFAIFRASDAAKGGQSVAREPDGPVATQGYAALTEAGLREGCVLRTLFSTPVCSLVYVWFKSGFPLPHHSHSADCLYFIVAGSLKIGSEELGPGDGFFLGADVPYSYVPGPEGVEVLEFRTSDKFDFLSSLADVTNRIAMRRSFVINGFNDHFRAALSDALAALDLGRAPQNQDAA